MKQQLKSKTLETKNESTNVHFLNTPINTLIQNKTHFAKSQVKQVLSTLQLTTIFRKTSQNPKVKSLTFKSSSKTESNWILTYKYYTNSYGIGMVLNLKALNSKTINLEATLENM